MADQRSQQHRSKRDEDDMAMPAMAPTAQSEPTMTASETRSALAPMMALVRRFMRLEDVLIAVEVYEVRLAAMVQQLADAEAALGNMQKRHADDVAAHEVWKEAMGMERTAMQRSMMEKP